MSRRQRHSGVRVRVSNLIESSLGTLQAIALRLENAPAIRHSQGKLEGLPVVGGLGSIPTRAADLPKVVDHILPQVERLHLFLHGYNKIPAGITHPRVIIHRGGADHPFRTAGKFYGLGQEVDPCIYCSFDDDILYLDGHVARLRAALLRYGGAAVVGTHSANFRRSPGSYLQRQKVRSFRRGLWFDQLAEELGTGAMAFVSTSLAIDPAEWPYGNMEDLMIALEAEARGLPRVAICRPAGSLIALGTHQPDSIYERVRQDDSLQTQQLGRLMALMADNRRRHPKKTPG